MQKYPYNCLKLLHRNGSREGESEVIKQGPYLNEYLGKRLLSFINKHHENDSILFWPDLCVVALFKTSSTIFESKKHQLCWTPSESAKCSSNISYQINSVVTRTESMRGRMGR